MAATAVRTRSRRPRVRWRRASGLALAVAVALTLGGAVRAADKGKADKGKPRKGYQTSVTMETVYSIVAEIARESAPEPTKAPSGLATVLDQTVSDEFKSTVEADVSVGKDRFNKTLGDAGEHMLETVVRESAAGSGAGASASSPGAPPSTESSGGEGVDKLVDAQDNVYILSNPREGNIELQLDPVLLEDLTLMFIACTVLGMALEAARCSPVAGYILSGALLGPGGFNLLHRCVVPSFASPSFPSLFFRFLQLPNRTRPFPSRPLPLFHSNMHTQTDPSAPPLSPPSLLSPSFPPLPPLPSPPLPSLCSCPECAGWFKSRRCHNWACTFCSLCWVWSLSWESYVGWGG